MSKENDAWFASVKECPFCGGSKFQRINEIIGESLRCLKCKEIIAASTDV